MIRLRSSFGRRNPDRLGFFNIMITPGCDADCSKEIEAVPDELSWRVHPFMENAWASVLLIAIIVATLVGVWSWSYSPGWVLIGALLLIGSMAPYLLPTSYHVTRGGIEIVFIGVHRFRGWDEFRNFYPHKMGAHLSTFSRPNGLDSFRGSFIRFTPGNRDAVLRFLDVHIKRSKHKPDER
jgi:hypothetical protein